MCDDLTLRAVQAAEAQANFALWQTGIQAGSLVGLVVTLLIAYRAWVEARKSSNAAMDTLLQNDRNIRHQLRPYLVVTSCNLEGAEQIAVTVTNCGATPAIRAGFTGRARAIGVEVIAGSVFSPIIAEPNPRTLTIAAGQEVSTKIEIDSSKAAGPSKIIVEMRLIYNDIWGERHETYRLAELANNNEFFSLKEVFD